MYNGTGIYSLRQAGRLVRAKPRDLNRWLFGYHFPKKGPDGEHLRAFSPPLWQTQVDTSEYEEPIIGFQDLLEIRFVRAFIQHGIPLIVIRKCLESARSIYGVAGIEYNGTQATKWYPTPKRERIFLDPSRQFGSPIIEDTGTPTDVLYASYLAEGENEDAIVTTSAIYDVPPRFVHSAVQFEAGLQQRAH